MSIRIISLFSGYDSPLIALDNLGIDYVLHAWSEIDPYAIKAHNILHPNQEEKNIGDIRQATLTTNDIDFLFYSSPCQDFSKGGRNKGGAKGSNTRSSLLWEVERFVKKCNPTHLLMENVPTLATTHCKDLNAWINQLEKLGYYSQIYIINALETGTPQNRKRLFLHSTLGYPQILPLVFTEIRNWRDYLDKPPIPQKYYIDTVRIPKIKIKSQEQYPILLGFSRVYDHPNQSSYHSKQFFNTICTRNNIPPCNIIAENSTTYRRLSTSERLRIMGLSETQIQALISQINSTQLDKLAGNSIVISCLETIFKAIYLYNN